MLSFLRFSHAPLSYRKQLLADLTKRKGSFDDLELNALSYESEVRFCSHLPLCFCFLPDIVFLLLSFSRR
jgi:hypothetical protein